jgi:hypothetical protein
MAMSLKDAVTLARAARGKRKKSTGWHTVQVAEFTARLSMRWCRIQAVALVDSNVVLVTHAEEVGKGPPLLFGYRGGYSLYGKQLFKSMAAAAKQLQRDGWHSPVVIARLR